jgi:hypothetical protein
VDNIGKILQGVAYHSWSNIPELQDKSSAQRIVQVVAKPERYNNLD